MFFKKHISILLAFFLLVSNLGLAFNVHYCDDKIASISINTVSNYVEVENDCCGKIEIISKCCNTKVIKSQEKSDQGVVNSFSVATDGFCVFNVWEPLFFTPKFHFKKSQTTSYHCVTNEPPLYLLYSQYTFYA